MTAARFGWLVSYPKSGNTWLRLMLASLMAGGAAVDINASALASGVCSHAEMDEFLGIESSELTAAEIAAAQPALLAAIAAAAGQTLLLRKVHDRFWHTAAGAPVFPPRLSRAAVYLVRDPRDVAVSYAHHRGVGVDDIIALMADRSSMLARSDDRMRRQLPQPLGRWDEHAASWLDQREIPVLALRFEDLVADPGRQLAAVADHLAIAATPAAIAAAVSATRFEVLQQQERVNGFGERQSGSTAAFFRAGRAGGWRQTLSPDQARRIETAQRAGMARFGYG